MIVLQNISKVFRIPHEQRDTLKENLVKFFHKTTYENFNALEDISFQVKTGETVGIIGKNGSGKSTLLKIIAGIYTADEGEADISGSIVPFLELGIGFQPELTARENIRINATLLGLNYEQILQKFDHIVSFANIEKFLDTKVKNFSSGMRSRLAFAIACEIEADIYLCDEVLAVGDEAFQKKCLQVFAEWRRKNKTLLIVSHNVDQLITMCDRIIVLHEGKVVADDKPEPAAKIYHNLIQSSLL